MLCLRQFALVVYRSKVAVLLMLIVCLLLLRWFVAVLCLILILSCTKFSVLSSFGNHMD